MSHEIVPQAGWRRSSFCYSGECVEVNAAQDMVLVRDSKDPQGGILRYAPEQFAAFIRGIRAGEFDGLTQR